MIVSLTNIFPAVLKLNRTLSPRSPSPRQVLGCVVGNCLYSLPGRGKWVYHAVGVLIAPEFGAVHLQVDYKVDYLYSLWMLEWTRY